MSRRKIYFSLEKLLTIVERDDVKLSIVVGMALTVVIYCFDPFQSQTTISKRIPTYNWLNLGFGILLILIDLLRWTWFKKIEKRTPHTYWLSKVVASIVIGIIGGLYQLLFLSGYQYGTLKNSFINAFWISVISFLLFITVLYFNNVLTPEAADMGNGSANMRKSKRVFSKPALTTQTVVLTSPVVNQNLTIVPEHISYLKACGNYVEIHLIDQKKTRLIRASLYLVAKQLKPYGFISQCHRKYYINTNAVVNMMGNSQRLVLSLRDTSEKIPVSRGYRKLFLANYKHFNVPV